jgi:hypothetical protein
LFCFCLDDIVLFDLINVFFLFLLLQVHDLHEDAIVRLLRYVITKSSVQYEGVDGLLQMIVATPYNGSFLRKNMPFGRYCLYCCRCFGDSHSFLHFHTPGSFLRRLTISETRFMLKFLHHLIRVQLQTPTSTGAVEEESGGVPRRNKTPAMSQAVGTLLVVLWLVCVVEWMFCG